MSIWLALTFRFGGIVCVCGGGVMVVAVVGPTVVALQLVGAKRSVGVISVVVGRSL